MKKECKCVTRKKQKSKKWPSVKKDVQHTFDPLNGEECGMMAVMVVGEVRAAEQRKDEGQEKKDADDDGKRKKVNKPMGKQVKKKNGQSLQNDKKKKNGTGRPTQMRRPVRMTDKFQNSKNREETRSTVKGAMGTRRWFVLNCQQKHTT